MNEATRIALRAAAPTSTVDACVAEHSLNDLPDYSTVEEVAALYRTTPSSVRFWVHTKRLTGVRVGKRRLFPRDELVKFDRALRAADAS